MNQDAEKRRAWALDQIAQHERIIADLRSFIEYLEASEFAITPVLIAGVMTEGTAPGTHEQDEAYERENGNRLMRLGDYIEKALQRVGGSASARHIVLSVTRLGYKPPPEGKSSPYERVTSELYRLSKEGRIRRVGRGRFSLAS